MIGSEGERMLRISVPYVEAWNAWYTSTGNRPEGVARLRAKVDRACEEVGRDPATLERTAAVLVQLSTGLGRREGGHVEPLKGSPAELADALGAFAREGISHVQLVLDPITPKAIEELAPVLEVLDRS